MYGKDYLYAQTRIQGTIVRIANTGEPVYVASVGINGSCLCIPIEQPWHDFEKGKMVHVDNLDMHPVPLGYVNCAGEATYLMRIPMRRDWKQGLRQENSWSSGRMLNNIPMKDVKNCIMNVFPTFGNALKGVKPSGKTERRKTIAWNRHWAVDTGGNVFYKNHGLVGRIDSESIVLDPTYMYLREALEETL